jgi:uncharacterized protein
VRSSVLRLLVILVILWFARLVGAEAQSGGGASADKATVIRELLSVTHAADQVLAVVEASVPAQRAANPRIPAIFWDRFLAQARSRRGEFVDSVIPLYARSFDIADLRAMLELYKSPFGQRLLEVQPELVQESMVIGQRWGARIGAEIGQQLAAEGVQIQP